MSVLLPVRHGPETAIAAVCAALTQRGVEHLDVVVLDDGCPAETRAALRRQFGDDPRVRILAAAPRPSGWSSLAHRSHQLAVAARGNVLIFAEPCAPLGPNAAASATALLRRERLDLAVLDSGRPAPAGPRRDAAQTANTGSSPWIHPGRFALAVDAASYWRIGGYRSAASDSHPLALLRTVRRASGRAAIADGRRVIPPAKRMAPVVDVEAAHASGIADSGTWPSWASGEPARDGGTGAGAGTGTGTGTGTSGRSSLGDSARRVLASLVGAGARE